MRTSADYVLDDSQGASGDEDEFALVHTFGHNKDGRLGLGDDADQRAPCLVGSLQGQDIETVEVSQFFLFKSKFKNQNSKIKIQKSKNQNQKSKIKKSKIENQKKVLERRHKHLNPKLAHVRSVLALFIVCSVDNPAFDSQTKETLVM